MNNRLRSAITLQDALHGFRQGKGAGTATMEAKLAQQLAVLVNEPLLQVFLYVQKAYNSLNRGRYMDVLRGYIIGPNLQRLLQRYWCDKVVVPKARKFSGRPFSIYRGVKQGEPASLMIFNILVNAVVREVLLEVCGHQEAHHGFFWAAGEQNIALYADEVCIAGWDPIWVQTTLTAMVRMF